MNLFSLDNLFLLLTGLVAIYLLRRFYQRYSAKKGLYDLYYMLAFAVLLVSGLLLIFLGLGILSSPWVLTVASLIPFGISVGLIRQYFPQFTKPYIWFATLGIILIAVTSFGGMETLRKIVVPVFHGIAGLVIVIAPFMAKKAASGFGWVGVGGVLIGLGGIALAFLASGKQLLFFSQEFVLLILTPLLLLMALAFAWGFTRDILHPKG
ncbi:MAG TPA: hypothetical protein PKD55_17360 [Bellilinea sp.]|nr:hypothetical protein [Bellilinea sp.]